MVYAAQIKATDNAITVGAYNNKPLVPIRAFDSPAELRAELDRIWKGGDGDNLIRVSRKRVEGWFGRNFQLTQSNNVVSEWEWENVNNGECR